jgi:transposase
LVDKRIKQEYNLEYEISNNNEGALSAVRSGQSKTAVNKTFRLGSHTILDWEKRIKETGSLEPALLVRKPRKLNRDELAEFHREYPDSTHKEAAEHFNCGKTTVQNALVAIGFTRKKNEKL